MWTMSWTCCGRSSNWALDAGSTKLRIVWMQARIDVAGGRCGSGELGVSGRPAIL